MAARPSALSLSTYKPTSRTLFNCSAWLGHQVRPERILKTSKIRLSRRWLAMPKKVYAVKSGRRTGIFNTWDEAKAQVNGYSGAQFKSFSDAESASNYMKASKPSSTPYSSASCKSRNTSSIENSSDIYSSKSFDLPGLIGKQKLEIYVDGSSLKNGRAGAKAGWGMYFGDEDSRNSSGPVTGEQTNNRAELTALKRALDHVNDKDKTYVIHTDSQYTLSAINTWGEWWEKNDWKLSSTGKQVKNQDLIKDIRTTLKALHSEGYDVELSKVKGHSDIHGNEQADLLAREGARRS